MAKKRIKLEVKASSIGSLDLSGIINHIAPIVMKAFDQKIGPHAVSVAKQRAPVSKGPSGSPRRSSFHAVQLIDRVPASRTAGPKIARLAELREMNWRERADAIRQSDVDLFVGRKNTPFAGRTPEKIDIMNGTVKGAFRHKPGALRDSIHWKSAEIDGNRVVAHLVADVPYALAVHEGFTHRGGRHHAGRTTRIPPQKYLSRVLPNIRGPLQDPSTYTG